MRNDGRRYKGKKRQISELRNEVKTLNEKLETMDRSVDCYEQYFRRNCLLIHGMKENDKENTNQVIIEILEKKARKSISQWHR